jgi:hypothetical protein
MTSGSGDEADTRSASLPSWGGYRTGLTPHTLRRARRRAGRYGAAVPVDTPEDLYGLPLEQFIDERAALAKQLRANDERDEAKRVAALKKPTVAAWAVNQLVRTQSKTIKALFQAGDDIAAAAAKGKQGAEKLREATKRQRGALDELMEAAEGLLSAEGKGLGAATLEHVSETLRAAALDPDARDEVAAGCLTRELQPSGLLGPAAAFEPAPAEDTDRAAQREAEQAIRQLKSAQQRRDDAKAAADDAQVAVHGAQKALDEAQAELASKQAELEEAQAELNDAQERAERAADALKTAQDR